MILRFTILSPFQVTTLGPTELRLPGEQHPAQSRKQEQELGRRGRRRRWGERGRQRDRDHKEAEWTGEQREDQDRGQREIPHREHRGGDGQLARPGREQGDRKWARHRPSPAWENTEKQRASAETR